MTRLNPKNLRLTKSAFEYHADPSFDLIEGGGNKALRKLVADTAKEMNFNPREVKYLTHKFDSGDVHHHICPDCDKDVFSSKLYIDCKECEQRMTEFVMGKNSFVCSNCSKSWIGYIYTEQCPSCRK